MFRILTSAAVAICVAGIPGRAQAGDENPREAPTSPAARPSKQANAESGARSRRRARSEPEAKAPWWQAQRSETPRPRQPRTGPWKRAVFRLKATSAYSLAETINKLLEAEARARRLPEGSTVVIVPDEITNSLMVGGAPEDVEQVGQLIDELDQVQPMVLIRVLVAKTTSSDDRKDGGRADKDPPITGLPDDAQLSAKRLMRELEPDELDKQGPLEVLSRFQVMTINQVAARLHVGGREPVVRATIQRGQPGPPQRRVEHVSVGSQLQVTPRVAPNGLVTMEMLVALSNVAPAGGEAGGGAPVAMTEAETTVTLADGETAVLGAVRSDADSGEEELLLVVSAQILHPEAAPAAR